MDWNLIDSGEIVVNGRRVTRNRQALRDLHREVGIVFQNYNLFPHLTVERNVMLGLIKGKGIPEGSKRGPLLVRRSPMSVSSTN